MSVFTTTTLSLRQYCDSGMPTPEHFGLASSPVSSDDMRPGDVLVQVLYASVDPYLRGRIKSINVKLGGMCIKECGFEDINPFLLCQMYSFVCEICLVLLSLTFVRTFFD